MKKYITTLASILLLSSCAMAPLPKLPPGPPQKMLGGCMDGSMVEIDLYKTETGSIILFKREGKPVGLMDSEKQEVYVYAERKTYSVDAVTEKYPTPCELPIGVGI